LEWSHHAFDELGAGLLMAARRMGTDAGAWRVSSR